MCNAAAGVDVVFALDASGSIEKDNFVRAMHFVGAVVQSLMIRTPQTPNGFQVALVSFADRVDVRFYLDTYTDKELMLAAINVPYTRGRTYINLALRYSLLYKVGYTLVILTRPQRPTASVQEQFEIDVMYSRS